MPDYDPRPVNEPIPVSSAGRTDPHPHAALIAAKAICEADGCFWEDQGTGTKERYLRYAAAALAAPAGCPCTLIEPCSPQCTCANSDMSGGCKRCVKYGSLEQRRAKAERLAAPVPPTLNREHFHSTYNGGWHGNTDGMKAFHHGMDTVFNALDEGAAPQPEPPTVPKGSA